METTKPSPPTRTHWAAGKKIIVAGAGLAGLSFVISLRKHWAAATADLSPPPAPIAITIYERDPKSLGIERQGYSLGIKGDKVSGGMQALQKLGILDDLTAVSITGTRSGTRRSGGFKMWDNKWNEVLKLEPKVEDNDLPGMRIARQSLCKGMLDALSPDEIIHWETSCIAAHTDQRGKVQVTLSNGKTDQCDIFIAADGTHSKMRASLRPKDKLNFTGAVAFTGVAKFPDGVDLPHPIDKDWGRAFSGTETGLFVSPIDQHRAVWYLSYLASEPRTAPKKPMPKEEFDALIEEALERGKSYAEPFQTLVRRTELGTLTVSNTKDKQPFRHNDMGNPSIIFIGDANHAMSPFSGSGANMALLDGCLLGEQVCNSDSLAAAIAAYDASSMPRSKQAIEMSHRSIELAHAQGLKRMVLISMVQAQGFKLMLLVTILRVMRFFTWR